MRLTDLDPGWCTTVEGRTGMGVSFRCPCKPGCGIYLAVWFANPIDGGPPAPPDAMPKPRWQRTGDTFETLTLTPSIDASKGPEPHWHGNIKGGEVDPPPDFSLIRPVWSLPPAAGPE